MSWTSAYHGEPHPSVVSFNPLLFLRGSDGKETEGNKKKKVEQERKDKIVFLRGTAVCLRNRQNPENT